MPRCDYILNENVASSTRNRCANSHYFVNGESAAELDQPRKVEGNGPPI